jgi:Leucine-rich repeat (LRR) protein/MFS family permease
MKKNDWIIIIATALYSYLFYKEAAGINFLIFSVALIALLLVRDLSLMTRKKWLLIAAGTLISGLAVAIYGNWLSIWANLISLCMLAGFSVSQRSSVLMTLFQSVYSFGSSVVFIILDAISRKSKQAPGGRSPFYVRLLLVLIPVLVTLLFFFLYRGSNAIFNNFAKNITLDFISWGWVFFTLLGFILLYGFFYYRRIKPLAQWDEDKPMQLQHQEVSEGAGRLFSIRNEYWSGILLFVMLNLLLLIVNALDLQYVYISRTLPEGLSHSEYVHQGVELLILSIIIAIAIILFVFRGNMNFYSKSRTLRLLATLWVIQNMIMVVSTIMRNNMYIEEFGGITYKRIGVYVYLVLALIGLITTWIKVWKLKSNWYLFRVNSMTWFWMLVLASLVNWDAIITRYNISHAKDLKELDKGYLIGLTPSTLPEMLAYNDTSDLLRTAVSEDYMDISMFRDFDATYGTRTLESKLHTKLYKFFEKKERTGWQSWNYDDSRIMKEIQKLSDDEKIKHLSLHTSNISSLTPLRTLDKITSLDLRSNNLKGKLAELSLFPQLQKLDLSNNGIDTMKDLPALPQLTELDLSGNPVTELNYLQSAPNLASLKMNGCSYISLQQLPPMKKMTSLYLADNTVLYLEELKRHPALERLVLRNATVVLSANQALPAIPSLKTLDLSYCAIPGRNTGLLEGVHKCADLEELDLSGNQLTNIHMLTRSDTINGYKKLRVLHLSGNQLETVAGIENFSSLEELNVSNNRLTSAAQLVRLTGLKALYASGNTFRDIEALKVLTRLEILDLAGAGKLTPATLKDMRSLKWLNISNTVFSDISVIGEMTNMETLYLQNNQISSIEALKDLKKLHTLNITGNFIRDYTPLYNLKQLKELYIDRIPAVQLDALKKALPNTSITVSSGYTR